MEAWRRIYDNPLDGHAGFFHIYPIPTIPAISDKERQKRLTRFVPPIPRNEELVKFERPAAFYTNIPSPMGIASEKNNLE